MDGVGMILKHLFNPNLLHLSHLNPPSPTIPLPRSYGEKLRLSKAVKASNSRAMEATFFSACDSSILCDLSAGPPPRRMSPVLFLGAATWRFWGLEKVYETRMWGDFVDRLLMIDMGKYENTNMLIQQMVHHSLWDANTGKTGKIRSWK